MNPKQLHPLTKYINNQQKVASKQARDLAMNWLIQHFPEAFETTQQIRPLKCGIIDEILLYAEKHAPEISKTKLRQALAKFTRSIEYLACLKAQEMRIDQNGNPTVPVTEEEAKAAAQKIKKHIEKQIQFTSSETKSTKPIHNICTEAENGFYTAKPTREKSPEITIRPKKRTFDEDAISRMKEKLGLKG